MHQIKKIESDGSALVVGDQGDAASDRTVLVDEKRTKISLNGKAAKSIDLRAGDDVVVTSYGGVVQSIEASRKGV